MLVNEDRLVDWIESKKGLVITRSKFNEKQYNFSNINSAQYACITGYGIIIKHFFTNLIQHFKKGVVLIIIESDLIDISKEQLDHINLLHCFTWNVPFNHSKMSVLPIGLNYNRQFKVLENWLSKNKSSQPTKLLCMNCSLHTDPSRSTLVEYSKEHWSSFCTILDYVPSSFTYFIPSFIEGQIQINVTNSKCYDLWKDFKFVLSPKGAGLDCHRTWEVLAMGSIPIVLSSTIDDAFKHLPVVIVDTWSEINEQFLQTKYDEIMKKHENNEYKMEKLQLDYWTKKFQTKLKMKRPKIHFITYANNAFENSKKRLLDEAHTFGEFDSIKGFGPDDIKREQHNEEFNKILDMPRGGGYWLWRHDIINETIKNIDDDDFLIYLDAGSTLNQKGKKRFYEYLQILDESKKGILSFQMNLMEKHWTTREIFDFMGESIDGEIANSGQLLGGILIMQKNTSLLQYMKLYSEIINNHPLLATDIFNEKQTHEGFQDNRHEQSITSILRKKMKLPVIDGDESWKPPFGTGESLDYPFWATRIRN